MGIVRFIIRRLIFMVVLVIGVSILIFFMINAIGNPIDILLAEARQMNVDIEEIIEMLKQRSKHLK